jgi:hypothetical protein
MIQPYESEKVEEEDLNQILRQEQWQQEEEVCKE